MAGSDIADDGSKLAVASRLASVTRETGRRTLQRISRCGGRWPQSGA
jgi:hypothetical protein